MRATALTLLALGTAFWLWFGAASAWGEGLGIGNWVAHLLVPGGVLLATLLVAWRWPVAGGGLLLLEGTFIAVGYPILVAGRFPWTTVLFVPLTMAAPPLAAGALLLFDERRGRAGAANAG
jgi:hypothetical protein